ncbi:AbrB/MazE/SpoVT family DNA-binding domain-containing protein [Escherichia coli]|nr:AbrB/MazE/SpoVT family DNA-binding domain-containing protein [Escherichia coli]
MRITIKRWGNSSGMVIPNVVMKELNLRPGQSVEAQVSNNQLILTPISRRYSLDELLAQCDMNATELSEQDV